MKICIVARRDLFTKRGGDTVLCEVYADYVRSEGGECVFWTETNDFVVADLYHAFNIDRPLEIYPKLRLVAQASRQYVLTSLHHPVDWVLRFRRSAVGSSLASRAFYWSPLTWKVGVAEFIKEIVRMALTRRVEWSVFSASWGSRTRWILENAACILLQSNREKQYIEQDFAVDLADVRWEVVPNPVVEESNNGAQGGLVDPKAEAPSHYDLLFVGRIETRKNPISLIRAAIRARKSLLLVGKENPNESRYGARVRALVQANSNIEWISGVSHQDLQRIYRMASRLVNPSYVEVSPLVDFEALARGTPVVATKYALHHEYLPAGTRICDPYDLDDLVESLSVELSKVSDIHLPSEAQTRKHLIEVYQSLV